MKRITHGLVAVTMVAAGLTGLAGAAQASNETAACVLRANVPVGNATNLAGTGYRGVCSNTATLTVELRRHRPILWDQTVATASGSGTNVTRTARAANVGGGEYYTRSLSSTGAQMVSSRMTAR